MGTNTTTTYVTQLGSPIVSVQITTLHNIQMKHKRSNIHIINYGFGEIQKNSSIFTSYSPCV